jgi:hypothetical protein
MLADREMQVRENRRLERNLKAARLRISQAGIEDINFRRPRGLDRSTMLNLAQANWVTAHNNILISGATGAGKTFIACALAPGRPASWPHRDVHAGAPDARRARRRARRWRPAPLHDCHRTCRRVGHR